ncbi:5-guanidino-2-oxopentanoate decarboxylase [Pseudoxanthobacter sp.]|uniref:5-guanidino-2-oxopentanoate decarboxylase n=1 Tax=Pseudoxanthobacter sp. TaxID=1925742 RepID=UPI002FE0670E
MATCGEVLIGILEAYGVEVVFGIPGVHNVELYRGLAGSAIRHVTPRHEQGAGFMADGYARATGRPGVCFTITGPGLTNILTAMGQAYSDSVPMLVIASVNSLAEMGTGNGHLHELKSQRALAEGVTAFSHTVTHPAQLPEVIARAMAVFAGSRPRPVYIEIPVDVITAPGDALPLRARPLPLPPQPPAVALEAAACLLGAAARPLVVLGGGAAGAPQAARSLAEALDAPVIMTINARGLLPPDHPLIAGEILTAPPLLAALGEADVVLAVGTEFGETEMYPWPAPLVINGALVRIDIDPQQIMRGPVADVALVGDAGLAMRALCDGLPAVAMRAGATRAAALRAATQAALPAATAPYRRVMETIDAILPDAIVVGDSTQTVYFANQFYRPARPRSFFNASTGYGTLGYGLPAAIGARIGEPERPVIALVGDGGVLFTIGELAAAVEAQAPVIVILWNNDGYGEIRSYMEARSITPVGVDLKVPDFMRIAEGFGCAAERVKSFAGLADALIAANERLVPTVIEIHAGAAFVRETA